MRSRRIQSAASSAQTTANTDLQKALTALTAFQGQVDAFVTAVGKLPPDSSFVGDVTTALNDVTTDLTSLQKALSGARRTNASLPLNVGLPDSLFGSADAFLRKANAMLPPSGLPTEITDALTALSNASNVVGNLTAHFDWSTSPGDVQPITLLGIPRSSTRATA